MKITLVFPVLPPEIDGIGDHTAHLAEELGSECDVSILTAAQSPTPIPGVRINTAFHNDARTGIRGIVDPIANTQPDWLVLQYNPFSYGTWGFNPYLISSLRTALQKSPSTKLAVIVHEPFLPLDSWRWAVMTTWQRWQFWALGRMADTLFFSTAPWAERFQRWFPGTPVHHLPVGSNIPDITTDRARMRKELNVAPDTFLLGVFGSGHPSRLLHFVRAATKRLHTLDPSVKVLYVGTAGQKVTAALDSVPVIDAGPLPAEDVAHHFSAMDLYLAPFRKGVSTRRGSFLAGLQQGVATISTDGIHTDPSLRDANGSAFLLCPDDEPHSYADLAVELFQDDARRASVAQAGAQLFSSSYTWKTLSTRFLQLLSPVRKTALT